MTHLRRKDVTLRKGDWLAFGSDFGFKPTVKLSSWLGELTFERRTAAGGGWLYVTKDGKKVFVYP